MNFAVRRTATGTGFTSATIQPTWLDWHGTIGQVRSSLVARYQQRLFMAVADRRGRRRDRIRFLLRLTLLAAVALMVSIHATSSCWARRSEPAATLACRCHRSFNPHATSPLPIAARRPYWRTNNQRLWWPSATDRPSPTWSSVAQYLLAPVGPAERRIHTLDQA